MKLCHALKVKNTAALACAAMNDAFVAAAETAKRQAPAATQAALAARILNQQVLGTGAAAPSKDPDPSAPIGLFEARFLGQAPVAAARGQDVVEAAFTRLVGGDQGDHGPPLNTIDVVLVVSGEGLKVVQPLSRDVLSNTAIKNLRSFFVCFWLCLGSSRHFFWPAPHRRARGG